LSEDAANTLVRKVNAKLGRDVLKRVETEQCFNVEHVGALDAAARETLTWLLRETYEPELFGEKSALNAEAGAPTVEVGPRLAFQSAWSTNAVSICQSCGLANVTRLERSRRFKLHAASGQTIDDEVVKTLAAEVHDRMTEQVYDEPLKSFELNVTPEQVYTVPITTEGRSALERVDKEMGLAFDDQDFDFYMRLFCDEIGRDPTNVELFDMAQSNSEHSRHWFFAGELTVDGQKN
jgi:phosphoribosylformylglycinamidine synthase